MVMGGVLAAQLLRGVQFTLGGTLLYILGGALPHSLTLLPLSVKRVLSGSGLRPPVSGSTHTIWHRTHLPTTCSTKLSDKTVISAIKPWTVLPLYGPLFMHNVKKRGREGEKGREREAG